MRWFLFASALASSGCSSVLGIDSDRHLVEEDAGTAAASPWACLSDPIPTPGATATMSFIVGDPSTSVMASTPEGQPIPGLVIAACTAVDFSCSNPIKKSVATDANGRTTLVVPGGFDGYFQAPALGDYLPSIYSREPVQASQVSYQSVLHASLVTLTAGLVGVKLDPTAGTVIPYVLDCDSQRGAGVVISMDTLAPSEKLFYLAHSVPSRTATATDATGGAYVVNVPAGTATVKATTPDGQVIATNTTVVRAGWATFVQLRPSQATLLTK